jgi:mono/diheme cytochrome c family protein
MTFDVRKMVAVLAAGALAAGFAACGGDDSGSSGGSTTSTETSTSTGTSTPSGSGGKLDGKAMFASTCGGCHTLKAAGTTGTVGPNLDDLKPDKATVLNAIKTGPGAMPSDLYTGAEAEAVADYVSANAGK